MILMSLLSVLALNDLEVNRTRGLLEDFFEDKSCVHWIGKDNVVVEAALQGSKIAVVNRKDYMRWDLVCTSSGYIVDQTSLGRYNFLPYKRFAVYGMVDLDLNMFVDGKAAEVMLVEDGVGAVYLRSWRFAQTILVSTFHYPPFVKHDEVNGVYGGMEVRMLEEVLKGRRIQYRTFKAQSWSLVYQDLLQNRTDVGVCGNFVSRTVEEDLDFAFPYDSSCATVAVLKPRRLPPWTLPFQPFSLMSWCATAVAILTVAATYWICSAFKQNCIFLTLDVLGVLLLNPSGNLALVKSIFVAWNFVAILVLTEYSAGLSCYLAISRHSQPISNFEQVLSSRLNTDERLNALRLTSKEIPKLIAANQIPYSPNREKELYKCSTMGNLVVLADSTTTSQHKRQLKVLSECYSDTYVALVLPKNSPYTKVFSDGIKRMLEHGLIQAWLKQSMYDNLVDLFDMPGFFTSNFVTVSEPRALSLQQIGGCLYAFLFGAVISSTAFFFELHFSRNRIFINDNRSSCMSHV